MALGWKLHGNGRTIKPGEVVPPEERLSWPRTVGIGAQHVVAPEYDAGQRTAHLVGGRMIDYIEMDKDSFAIMKLRPPKEVCGFTLSELDLRGRYGVNVLGILRPGAPFEYADATTRINREDTIVVSGDTRLLEYFANRP